MKYVKVVDRLPEQHSVEPHMHTLWVITAKYGGQEGFYDNGKFMSNYTCEILDVIAWAEIPKYDYS